MWDVGGGRASSRIFQSAPVKAWLRLVIFLIFLTLNQEIKNIFKFSPVICYFLYPYIKRVKLMTKKQYLWRSSWLHSIDEYSVQYLWDVSRMGSKPMSTNPLVSFLISRHWTVSRLLEARDQQAESLTEISRQYQDGNWVRERERERENKRLQNENVALKRDNQCNGEL